MLTINYIANGYEILDTTNNRGGDKQLFPPNGGSWTQVDIEAAAIQAFGTRINSFYKGFYLDEAYRLFTESRNLKHTDTNGVTWSTNSDIVNRYNALITLATIEKSPTVILWDENDNEVTLAIADAIVVVVQTGSIARAKYTTYMSIRRQIKAVNAFQINAWNDLDSIVMDFGLPAIQVAGI